MKSKGGLYSDWLVAIGPTLELLDPHLLDQRIAFENQFEGMSAIEFSYDEFEATRFKLVETIQSGLNESDKTFLLCFNRLEPDWSIYDFQDFPSVKWKRLNLAKFKTENPERYQQQLNDLERFLS